MSIIQQNVSLKPYNTFGIAVYAKYFASVATEAQLVKLFEHPIAKTARLLVLGGGSNMLFTADFDGLVIKMAIKGITTSSFDDHVLITAGGGEVWNDLVLYTIDKGFAGLENLTLIPGTVGASPIQNIGAYGVELKDVFYSCAAFEIATGKTKHFTADECKFGYRESVFKDELKGKFIITSVTYRLSRTPHIKTHYGAINAELQKRGMVQPGIKDVSAVVAAIRVGKLPDPSTIGNAGSFFKNPIIDKKQFERLQAAHVSIPNYPAGAQKVKLAAGWLIEQCGFKGVIVGNTGTWANQALVLVNHGGATGSEVYDFSESIIQKVQQQFGVALEREVNILP